ncbi:MAG: ATP-binding protein [Candidatus Sericytochromatia bacterium]
MSETTALAPFVCYAVGLTDGEVEALSAAAGPAIALHPVSELEALPAREGERVDAVVLAASRLGANPVPALESARALAPVAQVVFLGPDAALVPIRQKLILYGVSNEAWSFLPTDRPEGWGPTLAEARARAGRRRSLKRSPAQRRLAPAPRTSAPIATSDPAILRSVLDHAKEAILSLDLRGCVLAWNRSAEELYAGVPGAGLGQPVSALVAPAWREAHGRVLEEVTREGAQAMIELEHHAKDDRLLPVEAALAPVKDWRGRINGVTMIVRDVTERRLAAEAAIHAAERKVAEAHAQQLQEANEELTAMNEELQSQQEELQELTEALRTRKEEVEAEVERRTAELRAANEALLEADRYKDEFLSVISHELRTPLNFIMGFASILDDGVVGSLDDKQSAVVGKILAGSERMLSLVNDLLDFARIQAGRVELNCETVDYAALVEEVRGSLRPLAERKRLRLETHVAVSRPVSLDPDRLTQVLTNLVANAIKFTPEGGHVTITAGLEGDRLVTEVRDSGVGIAPEDVSKLFTPFKQLDMGMTRRSGGTGLGLSISRALVEAHGGVITAESEGLGKGATFRVVLPIDPAN